MPVAPEFIPQTPENSADWQLDLFIPKGSTQPHCASCLQPVTAEPDLVPHYGVLADLPQFLTSTNVAGRLHMKRTAVLVACHQGRLPACKWWGKYYIPRRAFIWFARTMADPLLIDKRRAPKPKWDPLDLRRRLIDWIKADPESRDQTYKWHKRLREGRAAYLEKYRQLKAVNAEAVADPNLPAGADEVLPADTTWYR